MTSLDYLVSVCARCRPRGRLQRRRKRQAETTQSGSMTCERERRMEPVKGGQRRVERCQSGHSNPHLGADQSQAGPHPASDL